MGNSFKAGKYILYKDAVSGKISKSIEDEFEGIEIVDTDAVSVEKKAVDPNDASERWEHIKTIPCPFQLDNPDVLAAINQTIENTNLNYELDVEISLSPKVSSHKHDIWNQVNPLYEDSDFSEMDLGNLSCNVGFDIKHQAKVTQSDKKVVKSPHTETIKELVENNPNQKDTEDLNKSQRVFKQLNDYVEENLSNELKRVVDRLVLEYFTMYERGEERQENINIIVNEEEKALRKRLQAVKGRVPTKLQKDFGTEREKFIKECFQALDQLAKEKKKLIQSKLAETVFTDLNPQQSLRRKFKVFDLSFGEILQRYSEQKTS